MEVQPLWCWPAPAAAAEQLLRRAGVPGVLTAADSTTGKTGGLFGLFFVYYIQHPSDSTDRT